MKRKRLTHSERRAQTREQMVQAARELFIEKGFAATSVADVAEAAGYTRGAFYCNFYDKSDLLIESLQRQQQELTSRLRTALWELRDYLQSDDRFTLWAEASLLARRDPAFRERFGAVLNDANPAIPVQEGGASEPCAAHRGS
ncbi:TetR family regulatory protein [Burkholderia cenocepacia]|uniref:TetR family regulatory protein n=1 Tax=Burkholderia cenocepacia TaxID=95486 RepID=A0A6J5JW34_9BURK|nr:MULTISPECIES: TetR family transcriptional regulator [Burkholderia cepacia complex]CAB3975408.1 TetR family regulatory protein [Burkholderia cenocepacia]